MASDAALNCLQAAAAAVAAAVTAVADASAVKASVAAYQSNKPHLPNRQAKKNCLAADIN